MLKKTLIILVLSFALTLLMVSSVAITAYASDEQNAENALTPSPTPQSLKNATPTGLTLLPSKVVARSTVKTEPKHNPAGSQMYVKPLTSVPVCDGWIDAIEWSDAYRYDVSDTTGQEDGNPDPLGTVILWLKQDENGIYFAIRNNADATLDDNDEVGLYFDDNHDGCWPASATNEGNNWLDYHPTGSTVTWRWIQDFDCGFPPSYYCTADNFGGWYPWTPPCFGIGIGPTGVVDYEVMIPYGTVDEYLDLTMPPDSLGFFMFCLNASGWINGSWPSQGYANTWSDPCYYGHLICGTEEEWPNHKMHFPQLPDLEGWDVLAVLPKTLADDWKCSATGPVTDIHFWGSWKNIDGNPSTDDFYTPMPLFHLSIHRNIPADPGTPWSRPGALVWEWYGEIPGTPFEPPAMEHWYNPNTGEWLCNDHVPYWRYDFVNIPSPFFQHKDSIYWLDISAVGIPLPYQWGWKSSRDHFMDDAVYTDNAPVGPWHPMVEPPRCNWFNVYFNSMGFPTDSGSTNYYGEGWYRYEYWTNMWFYDNPFTYERPKHIWLQFNINQAGPTPFAQFAINWSTPAWDELGMGRPPLPGENEMLYIGRQVFPVHPGPNTIDYSLPYNPEWVSIDFVATDVFINGWIWHECVQTSMDMAFVITGEEAPCNPPNIGCPADETQNQNGVYTTTTQWSADDGNPADPTIELVNVAVQSPLPPGISAANVNFLGPVPGLGVKSTWGTVTYTVADHCQAGGPITLIATNNCPTPNNTATCTFNVALTNRPPKITQPDSLEGFVNSTVQYDISGNDPNGDVINDAASILIDPSCGTYSITRTSGSGTSSGTWQISWQTTGCTAGTYLVIHDLTDICQATSYCTTKVHLSEETGWYWKPGYEDYAPNGMPDFDQKQDNWFMQVGPIQQWTFCGPVAVANCFWWFDSKYNVPPGAPGDGWDQFALVRDYMDALPPFMGPIWDDHDPWNVNHAATPWGPPIGVLPPPTPQPFVPGPQPQPSGMPPWGELVERLTWYFNTDGIQTGYGAFSGTNIKRMQQGIDAWLSSENLSRVLYERTWFKPTFTWVETLVEKSQDVILLLGFWYFDEATGQWYRCGGHYVTVAGVNSPELQIAFSDPFFDNAETGNPGRVLNGTIIPHTPGHDATVHNDAGNVSQDKYAVMQPSPSPGGKWALPNYPVSTNPWYCELFSEQNIPDTFLTVSMPWNGVSPVFTEVEYAVEISPWEYPPDCGDMQPDGVVNILDIVYLINYKFLVPPGPPPYSFVKADVNHDGVINVQDIVYLINYKFLVPPGPPPQCYDP